MRITDLCNRLFGILLLSLAALSGSSIAQPLDRSDNETARVIEAAITAMTGDPSGSAQNPNEEIRGTVKVERNAAEYSGQFCWKHSYSNNRFKFRHEFESNSSRAVATSGNDIASGNVKKGKMPKVIAQRTLPIYSPAFMLKMVLANPENKLSLEPNAEIAGNPALVIKVTNNSDLVSEILGEQMWYFDAKTLVPVRVKLRIASMGMHLNYVTETIDYFDFRSIDGILMPFKIVATDEVQGQTTTTLESVRFGVPFTPSEFDAQQ